MTGILAVFVITLAVIIGVTVWALCSMTVGE